MIPSWDGNWSSQPNATPDMSVIDTNQLMESSFAILTNSILVLGVLCVFAIIATIFIRQALKQLREKSNIGLFETTGTLMLIGGVLTILLIGYVILWISVLLLAIAFFQIKNQAPNTNQYDPYQPPTPTTT